MSITLTQQIENIKADNTKTNLDKFYEFLSLGLTENDACNVMGIHLFQTRGWARPTSAAPVERPSLDSIAEQFTFGVEIECLIPRNVNICNAMSAAGIVNHNDYANYNHMDSATSYKYMRDGSVKPLRTSSPLQGGEIVSPVLRDYGTLQKVCKVLNDKGCKVNRTCGLHVHVGAANLTDSQYVNVFKSYYYMQDLLNTIFAPSRRNNGYCKDLPANILNCTTRNNIVYALGDSRYFKVNVKAYNVHKTIEFRGHHGTTNFKKMQMWSIFCKKLVAWCGQGNTLSAVVSDFANVPFLNDSEKEYFANRAQQLNH